VKAQGERPRVASRERLRILARDASKAWQLYALLALPLTYLFIFQYIPMYGAQIAFRDFSVTRGVWGSPWVGFRYFVRFFHSYLFWNVVRNTVLLSFYQLVAGFPFPIILALSLNYVVSVAFKRSVQLVTYFPHFISTVVMVGIIFQVLDMRLGIVNEAVRLLGLEPVNFLGKASLFPSIYVWSGVWQDMGYGCIVYLAALAGVDPSLHEAAVVNGATKLQRIVHIDLPAIAPIAMTLLILQVAQMLDLGFEKVFLMQNPLNLSTSEIINTYVYKVGIASTVVDFSYASAIGLFRNAINFVLLVLVNQVARRSGQGMW
jgi:putative aldouronate transport system permease protein